MRDLWSIVGLWENRDNDYQWLIPLEQTTDCRIGFILKGSAIWTLNGRSFKVKSGDSVVVLPGVWRSATSEGRGFSHWAVRINLGQTGGIERIETSNALPDWMFLPPKARIGVKKIHELFSLLKRAWNEQQHSRPFSSQMADSLIRQFFIELYRAIERANNRDKLRGRGSAYEKASRSGPLDHALKYIHENLKGNLRVNDIADICGYSESQLRRIFKRELGMSPTEYFKVARIRRAQDLLQTGLFNVHEVAKAVGYKDPFHFSRRFKEVVGMAPSSQLPSSS